MNKQRIIALLAILLAALPVTVHAETWTYTWDGTGGFKGTTTANLNNVEWNIYSEGATTYTYSAKLGQVIGSSKTPSQHTELWTTGFMGKITAVRITARTFSSGITADLSVNVNGKSYLSSGNSKAGMDNAFSEYTFIPDGSAEEGKLQIFIDPTSVTKSFLLLQKIEVDYESVATTLPAPTFSLAGGAYEGTQQITMAVDGLSHGAYTIYYTTDGSNPRIAGTRQTYSIPVTISRTTLLKACTEKDGQYSEVTEAQYNITAALKAAFSTDKDYQPYTSQDFNVQDNVVGWQLSAPWTLKERHFSAIDENDKSSLYILYGDESGSATATSPEMEVKDNSKVEFYAYLSNKSLAMAPWELNVIDVESGNKTQLINAFQWCQDNEFTGGPVWTKIDADLSSYAGKKVKFEFNFKFGGEDELAIDNFCLMQLDANHDTAIKTLESDIVQFTDLSEGLPDTYLWTFEGGTPATSTDANPQVIYGKAGTYDVTLTIKRGEKEETISRDDFVIVSQKTPIAIIGMPETGYLSPNVDLFVPTGAELTFKDLSKNNPNEWAWTIGTQISSEQNPTVSFVKNGQINITLVAKNTAGESNTHIDNAIQVGGQQYVWNIGTDERNSIKQLSTNAGNYAGSNWFGVDLFAEKFDAPLADAQINKVGVYFASTACSDELLEIPMAIYTAASDGTPGDILGETRLKAKDLLHSETDTLATVFKFSENIKIKKGQEFFVIVGPFPSLNPMEDYIAIYCMERTSGKNTAWHHVDGAWDNQGSTKSIAIAPYIDYDVTSGIRSISVATETTEKQVERIYNISGQLVDNTHGHGIYIIRYTDGSTQKIKK